MPNVIAAILSIIDKIIPDAKSAAEAKSKLLEIEQNGELHELDAVSKILVADAQSQFWLQANWRPLTGISLSAIVVIILFNNYILIPYLQAFGVHVVSLQLDSSVWNGLLFVLGGCIGLRSFDKILAPVSSIITRKN